MRAKDKEFGGKCRHPCEFWGTDEVIWLFRRLRLEPWLRDDLGRRGKMAHTWPCSGC